MMSTNHDLYRSLHVYTCSTQFLYHNALGVFPLTVKLVLALLSGGTPPTHILSLHNPLISVFQSRFAPIHQLEQAVNIQNFIIPLTVNFSCYFTVTDRFDAYILERYILLFPV